MSEELEDRMDVWILARLEKLNEENRKLQEALLDCANCLEEQSCSIDSYGVEGSNFYICGYCEAESGAGLLNKGIPHDPDCSISKFKALAEEKK